MTRAELELIQAGGRVGDVTQDSIRTVVLTADGTVVAIPQSSAFRAAETARNTAVATRSQAVIDLNQAIADLKKLLPPGADLIPKFTVNNIDTIINDLLRKYPWLTDEIEAMRQAARVERGSLTGLKNASEELGTQAARDVIQSRGGTVLIDGTGAQASGANTFDVVGLSADGKTLVIVEAKGGGSQLSTTGRIVGRDAMGNPIRAPQGSVEYLNDLLAKDQNLKDLFTNRPDIADGLRDGTITIDYQLAKAPGDGTATIIDLVTDQTQINLDFLGE